MSQHKHTPPVFRNHLYRLRRIRRYRQKHLAHLLGRNGTRLISQYETGTALPPLRVAMLMEIVLGARISDIWCDLYRELGQLAVQREAHLPPTLGRHIRGRVLGKD